MIPKIRSLLSKPKVHLIAYAAPITKNMVHFNELNYYSLPTLPTSFQVPDWLSIDLGIFAGRLYFNYDEYAPLAKYIQGANTMSWDWEQESHNSTAKYFTCQPMEFLHEWLTTRRRGQDVQHTHMGYIIQGRPLHEQHPFFATRVLDISDIVPSIGGVQSGEQVNEADDEDSDVEEDWQLLDVGGAPVNEVVEGDEDENDGVESKSEGSEDEDVVFSAGAEVDE